MENNSTDLKSSIIKNYQNNDLKELKVILDRNDCIVNSHFLGNNENSKYKLQNNSDAKEKEHEIDITETKVGIHTKFLDNDTNYNTRSDSESSKESNSKECSVFCCEECSDTFQTMRALMHHTRFHIRAKGIVCTCALCGDTFKTNKELISHKLVHDSEGHCFKCNTCKVAFTNHHDFIQHNAKHINGPIYKCIECSFTFQLRKTYKNHITTHYSRQYKCNYCDEVFTLQNELNRHRRNNHYPGIDCVECGKHSQSQRDHLEHMSLHTGVKLYQCLYCGKGYSKHSGRRDHMRKMHTKFIPHECTICSEGFYNPSQLKLHMIIHETEMKYECDDCGRQFFYRLSLIKHVRQHMNYMLYKCPMCKRKFTTYQNLFEHTEIAHVKIKRYKCEVCNVSFVIKRSYRRHLGTHKHRNQAYALSLSLENNK